MTAVPLSSYVVYTYLDSTTQLPVSRNVSLGGLLGYNVVPDTSSDPVSEPLASVMVNILELQRLSSESRLDSVAVSIGDLKLDYNSYLGRMKAEASQQVKVLSSMTEQPIKVDIFSGTVPRSGNNQYQVRSTPFLGG